MTKKYFYFGKAPNGVMAPLFECIADEDPTAVQMNTIYAELVQQQGLMVPRPTHYAALELHEVPQADEVEDVPLIVHQNGNRVVN